MLPSSHSNAEQIRNSEFETLLLLLFLFLLLPLLLRQDNLLEITAPEVGVVGKMVLKLQLLLLLFLKLRPCLVIVSSVFFQVEVGGRSLLLLLLLVLLLFAAVAAAALLLLLFVAAAVAEAMVRCMVVEPLLLFLLFIHA
jgi:hypothetical protein